MSLPGKMALIAVTDKGVAQARLLRTRLKSGELFRPDRHGPAAAAWEHSFAGPLAEQVPALFAGFDQLIFFLAAGAVGRLVAPCLVSKTADPGVLAVDEAGKFVIPMLSGHKGGANTLARAVAGCLGAVAVITTASDVLGGLSPDLLEEEYGWVAEPAGRLKQAASALVNGAPVVLIQEVGRPGGWLEDRDLPKNVTVVRDVTLGAGLPTPPPPAAIVLWITDRLVKDWADIAAERILWYRPKSLVLGVGCERGISIEALDDGLDRFLQEAGYARASIGSLATVDVKGDEAALLEWARRNGWETMFFAAAELAGVPAIPNPSAVVEKCVGTPGVAEPAALKGARAERLLVEKKVVTSALSSRRMTFALARSSEFQETRTSGTVVFVGAGPGDPDLLTRKAHRALSRADVVVYAGSLIPEDILRLAPGTASLHNSAHLTLEEIMGIVLAAVCAGKRVVRLQSGDTSIYSAIQEQMTVLDEAGIEYEVIPGISSFQAAAAALKTELTLPEVTQTIILTRGEGETRMPAPEALAELARHQATLCIFLSARLAETVQEQLLTGYPADTPTAVLYRVSWPDEKIIVTELADLARTIREHKLTRTTLILVGQALGARRNRSRLYDKSHGHIFRRSRREEKGPAPERHA
jgi:precorrin-4 C11-methyltransferase